MNKVVVVGCGGFGREVIEIFKDQNKGKKKWDILGFVDDDPNTHGKYINDFPVLGGISWLIENHHNEIGCVIAIGEPKTKKLTADKLESNKINFVNAIHPSVIMSEYVELGKDVIICAGSILTVNIKIGNHVIININSTVGHDTVIEDYCSIMPTVKINGDNHLYEGVYVGTGATFIHQVSVGGWTTIGAGAVVVNNIPENVIAVGIPAKMIKQKIKS
ncbi:MAG: acetyltransferase [Candidatus Thermoplasmatota archaeon]|nr:acetyltransferase [Candidatus Thermoplasmatota archaeon]MBU4256272.1 acetyltransferase [Candidatus Thermoplasmatota archaeon]MCG2825216.1 acetyltransferase [Thermoplasmatales archaeon]